MPALKSQRQERFAQLIKQGVPPYRAYPLAGYRPNNGAPYHLAETRRVKARIAELNRGMAMKTRVTVDSISSQLDEDRQFAVKVDQAGPALNATIAKAKLHGLMVDRKESGAPGEFANLQTADEVLALVRAELGEAAAAALVAAMAQQEEPAPAKPIESTAVITRDPGDTLQ